MSTLTAVYPGSFDPVTYGHLDLIQRSTKLFDHLIVAVVSNPGKTPLFTLRERLDLLHKTVEGRIQTTVEVDSFDGLLVDFMNRKNAHVVIRGFRAVSDFEFEFEMALTNRRLDKKIETVFMAPSEEHIFLRASLVKEIAQFGGSVSDFVPSIVEQQLHQKFQDLKLKQNQIR